LKRSLNASRRRKLLPRPCASRATTSEKKFPTMCVFGRIIGTGTLLPCMLPFGRNPCHMFSVQLHNSLLYVNNFHIVDLGKPFKRIIHNAAGIDPSLRTPAETLATVRKPLPYYVKFAEDRAGALFNMESRGFKCHWVYETQPDVSGLFRDKALLTLLHGLDTDSETYKSIRNYLRVIVRLIAHSFEFDCIVTSLPCAQLLCKTVPILHVTPVLRALPLRPAHLITKRYRTLRAVLKGHPEGIPLSVLNGESLNLITLRHTSFEKSLLAGMKNILILEGTNVNYSGFLAKELMYLPGISNVLPCTLFRIGTM